MIAICRDHHPEADVGTFTVDQLHEYRRLAREEFERTGITGVEGRFNWMRRQLVVRAGGSYYFAQGYLALISDADGPLIWLSEDESQLRSLNIDFPLGDRRRAPIMRINYWMVRGRIRDLECPPSGKRILVRLEDRDKLLIDFQSFGTTDELERAYPGTPEGFKSYGISYPIVVCSIELVSRRAGVSHKQNGVYLNGMKHPIIKNCYFDKGVEIRILPPSSGQR